MSSACADWRMQLSVVCTLAVVACASGGPPPIAARPEAPASIPVTALPPPDPPEPEAPAIPPVDPATAPKAVPVAVTAASQAVVAAKDRTDADRALDAGRHPGELLSFFGIKPGMKVAELFAAGGYTAELLARAVGKSGKVYAQNTKGLLEKFGEGPWVARWRGR